MEQMEHQVILAMSITTVCTVLTRCAPLKSQLKTILTVRFLFSSAWFFSQSLISSCKQSTHPHQADEPILFHSQWLWQPATSEEVDIASARWQLDSNAKAAYMQKLEKSSENIKKAFQNQQARAIRVIQSCYLLHTYFLLNVFLLSNWNKW